MNSRRFMASTGFLPLCADPTVMARRGRLPHAERTTEEDGRSLGHT
jgi:hypothetical protein